MTLRNSRGCTTLVLLLVAVAASELGRAAWIPAKALAAQVLLERAWHAVRSGGAPIKPWPWADTWPVARLTFARLEESVIVLAGATGSTLAFGPGHTDGSALPGRPGTSIVSGHRDTHFALLRDVSLGDSLMVESPNGRVSRYVVETQRVVDARTTRVRAPEAEDVLVLITCWPFDALVAGGPMRLLVTARLQPDQVSCC